MNDRAAILILGGYGSSGMPLARLLLEHTEADVILAGRSIDRASQAAQVLNGIFAGGRVSARRCDAADGASLVAALEGADLLVNTASAATHVQTVIRAALDTGVDYLDIQFSARKTAYLQSMQDGVRDRRLCFVTDGGFHPGVPAAMVRLAASRLENLDAARVGSVIKIEWKLLRLSPETIDEFMQEFLDIRMVHFQGGRWENAGLAAWLRPPTMEFGGAFGKQPCMPMLLEEMRSLPEIIPTLQETGFYIGGFNPVVDWVLSPILLLVQRLFPGRAVRPLGRLLRWGLDTFSRPPYGTALKLEARTRGPGLVRRLEMTVSHADGYMLTAIPTAACLVQLLDGSIRKPGVHLQACLVEPERFFRDIARMGAEVVITYG